MTAVALVPFRGLDSPKRRLSAVLSLSQRQALACAMLRDVVAAVRASAASPQIVVVTQSPASLRDLLPPDTPVVADAGLGLNAAIEGGLRHCARSFGDAASVLVVPADLPFLRADVVDRAFTALADADMVLARATADDGTNLLGQSAAGRVRPAFGRASFTAHVAAAARAGLRTIVLEEHEVGRDIDRPDDLLALAACARDLRSARLARDLLALVPSAQGA